MKSQYRVPLGDGRVKVILWSDWIKHKFDKPELFWIEEEPLKIFPDCKRNDEIEHDNR